MAKTKDALVITNAARSRSLDLEERQKRYILTMGVRTALFVAFLIVPGWWKVVTLLLACILALVAVTLATNMDHRPPPTATTDAEPTDAMALTTGEILTGSLEEDET